MTSRQRVAARDRILDALRKADEGGYGGAWYFYVDRRDVEAVLGVVERVETAEAKLADAEAALEVFARCCETGEDFPNQKAACCGDPGDCGGCEA